MFKTVQVKVVPRAKRNEVRESSEGYKVYLTAPPVEGRANKSLLDILAKHLKLKKSQLCIIKGERSKVKVVKINY